MAVATLVPTSTQALGSFTVTDAASAHQAVSDASDSSYVTQTGMAQTITFELTDVADDFDVATAISISVRWRRAAVDDTFGISARIVTPESVSISPTSGDQVVVTAATGTTAFATTTISFASIATGFSKAHWDRARLIITVTGTTSMGADAGRKVDIAEVSLSVTYNVLTPAFGRAYAFNALSILYAEGFEANLTGTGNVAEVIAGAAKDGDSGVHVSRVDSAGNASAGVGNSSLPPSLVNARMWYGVHIKFLSLPSTDTTVLRLGSGSGTSGLVRVDASGNLTVRVGAGSSSPTIATLSVGTWYWLELLHDTNSSVHVLRCRVDLGTPQIAVSTTGQTATTSRFNAIGIDLSGGGTFEAYYDNLIEWTNTQTWKGRRKAVTLRPNGVGAVSSASWTPVGAATEWESVDEVTPDNATTYVTSIVALTSESVALETYTLGSGESFEGVSVFGRVGSDAALTSSVDVALRYSGSTAGSATWDATLNGWKQSSAAVDVATPPGGGSWSQTVIDGLEIQFTHGNNVARANITALWANVSVVMPDVEVDVTPPVVTVTAGPTPAKISAVSGFNSSSITFSINEACQAWELRSVAASGDARNTGTQPLVKSGGSVAASTPTGISVTHAELASAGVGAPPDGSRILKFFVQDLAGNWSG